MCVFVLRCGAVSTFDCIGNVRYSVVGVLVEFIVKYREEELGLLVANIRANAADN